MYETKNPCQVCLDCRKRALLAAIWGGVLGAVCPGVLPTRPGGDQHLLGSHYTPCPRQGTVHLSFPIILTANLEIVALLCIIYKETRAQSNLHKGTKVAELELQTRGSKVLEIPKKVEVGLWLAGAHPGMGGCENRKSFLVSGQPI